MDKAKVRERILEVGIIPVVRASSAGEACIAAEAVCKGGIPIVEITMTVPGAVELIRELVRSCGSEVLIVDVRLQGFNGIHLAILARELRPADAVRHVELMRAGL